MEDVEPRYGKDQIRVNGAGGTGLLASRWDEQYRKGRYENEEPVAFVWKVVDTLRHRGDIRRLRGLYVGCGNGRNYAPLAGAGLDGLAGIDVSEVAVDRLSCRCPHLAGRVRVADFATFEPAVPLDYIVAIQVFQHGDENEAAGYLERSFRLLGENGLLFLRVNSSATDVYFGHRVVDRNGHGGFTVRYTEGPKRGLAVHFFAADEIRARLGDAGFEIIGGPEDDTARRAPPQGGTWSQWEVIAAKPARSGEPEKCMPMARSISPDASSTESATVARATALDFPSVRYARGPILTQDAKNTRAPSLATASPSIPKSTVSRPLSGYSRATRYFTTPALRENRTPSSERFTSHM